MSASFSGPGATPEDIDALKVTGLGKTYPAFTLKDVSFSAKAGRITGFIGRNGAGKTTTLSSLFNLVHPDSGEVSFFGKRFAESEMETKRRVAFVSGSADYFPRKKLSLITSVTRSFYPVWNATAYGKYLELFRLDESKTPAQLSSGMKVKYALALALSRGADFLVLDEPTSGLDPVSRDELLDVFLGLSREGTGILFSTHITSDLDACADDIVYIKEGAIVAAGDMKAWVEGFRLVKFPEEESPHDAAARLIGLKRAKTGWRALVKAEDLPALADRGATVEAADLESIMIHMEKN